MSLLRVSFYISRSLLCVSLLFRLCLFWFMWISFDSYSSLLWVSFHVRRSFLSVSLLVDFAYVSFGEGVAKEMYMNRFWFDSRISLDSIHLRLFWLLHISSVGLILLILYMWVTLCVSPLIHVHFFWFYTSLLQRVWQKKLMNGRQKGYECVYFEECVAKEIMWMWQKRYEWVSFEEGVAKEIMWMWPPTYLLSHIHIMPFAIRPSSKETPTHLLCHIHIISQEICRRLFWKFCVNRDSCACSQKKYKWVAFDSIHVNL